MAAHDFEADAELRLCSIVPTTMAGAAALLAYTVDNPCKLGCKFSEFADDDGIARPFEFFVIQNCADALENLSATA
jgi:hypothetical protein